MNFEELVNQKPGSIIELKNGEKLLIENTATDNCGEEVCFGAATDRKCYFLDNEEKDGVLQCPCNLNGCHRVCFVKLPYEGRPERYIKSGVEQITEERNRQILKEGWTSEHDDEHVNEELANMAATYALPPYFRDGMIANIVSECTLKGICPTWPYFDIDIKWFKPSPEDRIKELRKAGALIAAEIDRLNRKNKSKTDFYED